MPRARCRDCGKTYRVPDAAREYACKACGGVVAALEEEEAPVESEYAPPFSSPSRPKAARSSIAVGVENEERSRRLASRELGRARRLISAVRGLYATNAVLVGLIAALMVWTAYSMSVRAREALEETGARDPTVVAGLFVGLFAFMVAGAVLMRRQPVFWSIGIAATMSGLWLFNVSTGGFKTRSVLAAFYILLMWCAVPFMVRAKKLLEAYPDLWVARRLRGERHELKGGEVFARSREAAAKASTRSLFRFLTFGGVAIAGVAIVALLFFALGDDEVEAVPENVTPFGPVGERFRDAWNASRHDEIPRFYREASREKMARTFSRLAERRGWKDALPRLAAPDVVPGPRATCEAVFMLERGGGVLRTAWEFTSREGWVLRSLSPP